MSRQESADAGTLSHPHQAPRNCIYTSAELEDAGAVELNLNCHSAMLSHRIARRIEKFLIVCSNFFPTDRTSK